MTDRKVVLVTGASSGIGRAIAMSLYQKGFWVFGTSRNPTVDKIDGFDMISLDVCNCQSVDRCVQTVLNQTGRLDVLVNNAGYFGPFGAVEEISLADAKNVFETNFFGMVRLINAILPAMRRQRRGHIINISSIAGVASPPIYAHYAATKHAVKGYSEALRYEVKHLNIKVACIEPGYYKTNLHNTKTPPQNLIKDYQIQRNNTSQAMDLYIAQGGDPNEVAQTVLKLVMSSSPPLQNLVGFDGHVIAWLKNYAPTWFFEQLGRWLFNLDNDAPLSAKTIAFLASYVRFCVAHRKTIFLGMGGCLITVLSSKFFLRRWSGRTK